MSPLRRPCAAAAVLLAALTLSACGSLRGVVAGSTIPLQESEVEELAAFQCVTAEAAVQAKKALNPGDDAYARSALLYQATRDAYNPVIQGIARDVERGAKVDVPAYWTRFEAARDEQQALVSFVAAEASGFGFIGLETLLAAATPYAKRYAKQFVEKQVRQVAADYLRDELLLPSFAEVEIQCADEEEPEAGATAPFTP